jgi:hypothetical protein
VSVLLKLSPFFAGSYLVAAKIVFILAIPAVSSADSIIIKQNFHAAFRCSSCSQNRSNRLVSEVVELAGGPIVSSGTRDATNSTQLSCQSAIASAATEYVARRIDMTERGFPPEKADRRASRELKQIDFSCRITVSEMNGMILPRVGSPCASYVGPPGSFVDVSGLHACLRRTLDFYTDYLAQ